MDPEKTQPVLTVCSIDNERRASLQFYRIPDGNDVQETAPGLPFTRGLDSSRHTSKDKYSEARDGISLAHKPIYSSELNICGLRSLGLGNEEGVEIVTPGESGFDLIVSLKKTRGDRHVNGCCSIDDKVIASSGKEGLFLGDPDFEAGQGELSPLAINEEGIDFIGYCKSLGNTVFYAYKNQVIQAELTKHNTLRKVREFTAPTGYQNKVRGFDAIGDADNPEVVMTVEHYEGGGVRSPGSLYHFRGNDIVHMYREPLAIQAGTIDARDVFAGRFLNKMHAVFSSEREISWKELDNPLMGGSVYMDRAKPTDMAINNENIFVLAHTKLPQGVHPVKPNRLFRIHKQEGRPLVCHEISIPSVTDAEHKSYIIRLY